MATSEFFFPAHRIPQKKVKSRVLDLVQRHGLSVLTAFEVFILLRHHAEGTLFAASFLKRKVCPTCVLENM